MTETAESRRGRASGYVRVSIGEQAESGLGLMHQRTAVAAIAERLVLPLAETFEDAGFSGALDLEDRPGLLNAIGALKRGDVLIVARRDRLGRDVVAVALIERLVARKGARIVSAAGEGTESDDPTAILIRRIHDVFAEYERLLIGSRTKAALRAKKAQGLRVGTIPYGFLLAGDGRTLQPNPTEQHALKIIRECRDSGYTLVQIAAELNRRDCRTRAGSEWRHQYVSRLLNAA